MWIDRFRRDFARQSREDIRDGLAAAAGSVQHPRLQPELPQRFPELPVQQLRQQVTVRSFLPV